MIQDLANFAPHKKIMISLWGTYQPKGGMFEYAKAWIDQLSRSNWAIAISGSQDVSETLQRVVSSTYVWLPESQNRSLHYWQTALSSVFQGPKYRSLLNQVSKHIADYSPEVVHIVDIGLANGQLMYDLCKQFPSIIFICTVHDPLWHEERISYVGRLLKWRCYQRIGFSAKLGNGYIHVHGDRLIVGSAFQNTSNVVVMPHPLPVAVIKRTRPEPGSMGQAVRVGFLGRIERYKGLSCLIDALEFGIEQKLFSPQEIQLVVAGDGDAELSRICSLQCEKDLIINQKIDDEAFHSLIANLDILVLPYLSATHSGVGLLGQSYGVPMIVSSTGLLPSLVGASGGGLVFHPGDCRELAIKLGDLIRRRDALGQLRLSALEYLDHCSRSSTGLWSE